MKSHLSLLVSGMLIIASTANAQTPGTQNSTPPASTSARPDARYPNPSGQDSKPTTTPVKPTKTAPATAHPEESQPATTGAASKHRYQDGKKRNDSAGCSTPTDAASAGVKPPNSQSTQERQGKQTVCTTSGGDDTSKAPKNKKQRG